LTRPNCESVSAASTLIESLTSELATSEKLLENAGTHKTDMVAARKHLKEFEAESV